MVSQYWPAACPKPLKRWAIGNRYGGITAKNSQQ
jgi:hypothetical protein